MVIDAFGKQFPENLVFSSENPDESGRCCPRKIKNPRSCKDSEILFRVIRQNLKKYSPQNVTEDKFPPSPFYSSRSAISDGRKIIGWDIFVGGGFAYSPDNRITQVDMQVYPYSGRNDKTIQTC
jgi:hypothetical protein